MKVLLIGQLPKDVGGNYTTGIAKVVYELSKQKCEGIETFFYATNIEDSKAKKLCTYPNQYMGYKFLLGRILLNIVSHPLDTIRQWKIYSRENKVNSLRFELYKANFQKAIEEVKPDLIHHHGVGLAPMYFARKDKNIPIILTCHGVFQRFVNQNSQEKRYADYVTGLTSETREEITKFLCVESSKVTIIPNGVDTKKFYFSDDARTRIRKQYGVSDSTIVFVTVASVQERKGQLRFAEIIKNLQGDWQYWIIGKGPDEQVIMQFAEDNNLKDRIKLLGYRESDELYQYYSAADFYAHASTMEGQALCEIEAYTTGIRTIVNSLITGTIATDVHKDIEGYYIMNFEKPDIKDLLDWINKPVKSRITKPNFDWNIIANKYADLYNEIDKNTK